MSDCITHSAPEPVFEQPWHAQVFAMTVALNESGQFSWPDWATKFSATLKAHGVNRDLDGGEDYFNAWLETLEALLADQGQAAPGDVQAVQQAWEDAYLTTPHGKSVHLTSV